MLARWSWEPKLVKIHNERGHARCSWEPKRAQIHFECEHAGVGNPSVSRFTLNVGTLGLVPSRRAGTLKACCPTPNKAMQGLGNTLKTLERGTLNFKLPYDELSTFHVTWR
jgi:hypothetical protein